MGEQKSECAQAQNRTTKRPTPCRGGTAMRTFGQPNLAESFVIAHGRLA